MAAAGQKGAVTEAELEQMGKVMRSGFKKLGEHMYLHAHQHKYLESKFDPKHTGMIPKKDFFTTFPLVFPGWKEAHMQALYDRFKTAFGDVDPDPFYEWVIGKEKEPDMRGGIKFDGYHPKEDVQLPWESVPEARCNEMVKLLKAKYNKDINENSRLKNKTLWLKRYFGNEGVETTIDFDLFARCVDLIVPGFKHYERKALFEFLRKKAGRSNVVGLDLSTTLWPLVSA